jgi:hypothetical protein
MANEEGDMGRTRGGNEPSSARLAHLASSEKWLGSARSGLASRLAEPTYKCKYAL